jgi:spore maturation protein CgeB
MRVVVLGLSITSSWGNGHATTYRALLRELAARGHDVLFLERDVPWYAHHRDLPHPPFLRVGLYASLAELRQQHTGDIRNADLVVVGSFVPEGVAVGDWVCRTARGVTAFYDIDTPVTLAKLRAGDHEYIAPHLVGRFQLYLSFTGGPILERLEREYAAQAARPLYCSFDPSLYFPEPLPHAWDLGYMGTYSDDRQPTLERLLVAPARSWGGGRFVVAGPQYPAHVKWRPNIDRFEHLPPSGHRAFYNRQRFTLNVTRASMIEAGYSPSVRLFEAAACGTPIISDAWNGLETLLRPNTEILVATSARQVIEWIVDMPDTQRRAIAERARARVQSEHTAAHRAGQLEAYVHQLRSIEPAA